MEEKERSGTEFDLEEILKEFGDAEATPRKPEKEPEEEEFTHAEALIPEDILREESSFDPDDIRFSEDILIWDGKAASEGPKQPAFSGDTVRLDEVVKTVRSLQQVDMEETARFVPVGKSANLEETTRFTPVGGPAEPEILSAPETPAERVEPYSKEWEPEYEQPIRDYVPQEPIVFRPKSRLRELKRKLMEGPEKRYYELLEQGVGKLQLAMLMTFLVTVLSAAATFAYATGNVPEERVRLVVFGQFFGLLVSGLFGSYQLLEGVNDLFHKRFSLNTLLVFTLAICCVDGVMCLKEVQVPCCAAFSLHVTMSLWSAYQKRNTEISQMDTLRKAIRLDSLVAMPDYYEGRTGFLRGEGDVDDFMDTYREQSGAEKVLSGYALAVFLASIGVGVTAGVLHSVHQGVQAASVTMLVAAPATSFLAVSRPTAILSRRFHKLGTVFCGWRGVLGLSRDGTVPLRDDDLFPAGSVKMNGVKFYGSRDPDEVIAYATALISAEGGGLAPLFNQLLESRSGYHYEATGLRSYPNGGIGGEVNGEALLAGTLSFMQEMGVEMPHGTRVNQAIYLAIDGTLSGVFAVTFQKTKAAAAGLTTLCAYRKLTPVMTSCDFMLTESFLRSKFGVNTRRISFPARSVREELSAVQPESQAQALALITKEGLGGAAFAVTGARALRSACRAGAVIHMVGGILGLLMMLALAIVGAEELLTPANVLMYELIWMVPGLLITEWTRSV